MLTEESVDKLKALIDRQAEPDRAELTAAMDDIGRAIATQALLLRNMRMELEAAHVNQLVIEQILRQASLEDLLSNLDPPKRNPFTMSEAKTASEELVAKVNSASDFTEILKGVVQVAKVFI